MLLIKKPDGAQRAAAGTPRRTGALGGSAGNGRLRELLGWDEPTDEAVHRSLVTCGQLVPGRGRGGSVSLGNGNGQAPQAPSRSANGSRGASAQQAAPPPGPQPTGKQNLSAFIWGVADLLRGDYKQSNCCRWIASKKRACFTW